MTCRIVVFEDDPLYRASLVLTLRALPRFRVIADHESPHDTIEALERGIPLSADLALMDLEMPELDGASATRRLKAAAPHIKVVVLTAFDEPHRILEAICAGADGYLIKRASHDELAEHLHAVLGGGAPMTSGVARTVLDLLRDRNVARYAGPPLSPREHDVLAGFVAGKSYKHIAADLEITIDTVRTYVRTLYKKLQVNSVAAAVSRALRDGIVRT
jgi:two-component system, NarL family, nitrate/nitrite response regulator NarL